MSNALKKLQPEKPITAKLKNDFTKIADFRQFVKSTLKVNTNGELVVSILSGQESFKISPMAEGNAWTILPENQSEYKSGSLVNILPFNKDLKLEVDEE